MAGQRAIIRIQLDSTGKEDLEKICDKRGMTQIAVMSRLVGWFVKQDDIIQTTVLAQLSEPAMAQLARQMLKHIATSDAK